MCDDIKFLWLRWRVAYKNIQMDFYYFQAKREIEEGEMKKILIFEQQLCCGLLLQGTSGGEKGGRIIEPLSPHIDLRVIC